MQRFWLWLCGLLGFDSTNNPDQSNNRMLLAHFMRSLRDEFLYAQHPSGEPAVVNDPVAQRIVSIFQEEKDDWARAYEIQRLLVYLKPSNKLAIDADRRVAEAENLKIPSAVKYRAQMDALVAAIDSAATNANSTAAAAIAPGPDQPQRQAAAAQARLAADQLLVAADNQRRAILAAALDDLQWFYNKRNMVRTALNDSAVNLLHFGYWTLFVAASPFLFFMLERHWDVTFFSKSLYVFPNYGLYTAASFGLVGAFFSRLISLNFAREYTIEEAENLFSRRSLRIRASVGVSGAIIMYFLLHSAIIGLAAPDFKKLSFEEISIHTLLGKQAVLLPSKDWALLIIWSILAGFSEKLVPENLTKAETQVSSKK